jgi:hypothetical protein
MLHQEVTETEELLKKVLNAAPARRDVRLRLAELMIANKEPLPARVVLKPLIDSGEDDYYRLQARNLADDVQRYLDSEQALREYQQRRREAEERAAALREAEIEKGDTTVVDNIDGPPTIRRSTDKPTLNKTPEEPTFRLKRPDGRQIQGVLLSADCNHGLTLKVRVGNGNVELHADDPSTIEFLSYTNAVTDSFACGALKSEPPVLIVYKRGSDARYLGIPIRVEFLEKK